VTPAATSHGVADHLERVWHGLLIKSWPEDGLDIDLVFEILAFSAAREQRENFAHLDREVSGEGSRGGLSRF